MKHAVTINATKQSNGHATTAASPDHLVVPGYDPDDPVAVVEWTFSHKSTVIRFNDSDLIPSPASSPGRLTLVLPKGLVHGKSYKYTITGKYDDATDLDPNDPDVEVTR